MARTMWKAAGAGDRDRRHVRVLEADPDLGIDLDPETFRTASAELLAPVASIDWVKASGRWGPRDPHGYAGLLIVNGMLMREVRLLGTSSAEVLGEGDVLRPWDVDGEYVLPMPAQVHWTVLAQCEVAILNAELVRRAGRYPEVLARMTGRAVGRAHSLALHDAITNLKHVETRLLVQFWHLAERFGRVSPDSISVAVPLTHEMLAKLVGATRPSVSTGLGRLAARGLLLREPGGSWQLSLDSRDALEPLPVQPATRLPA